MTQVAKIFRTTTLAAALLAGAFNARAAETSFSQRVADALPKITAGSAGLAAANLLKARQSDAAGFESLSKRLIAQLKIQGPDVTGPLAELLGSKYDRGLQVIENDKKPTLVKTVQDEKDIEGLVLDFGPIYGQDNLERLRTIWPKLPAKRKALERAEKAMAQALEGAFEDAAAPAPAVPAASPRPENEHLGKMRLVAGKAVDMILGHNFLKNHNAQLYARAASLKDAFLSQAFEPAYDKALFEHIYHEAGEILKAYADWLAADKPMMAAERERRKADVQTARTLISQVYAAASAGPAVSSLSQADVQKVRQSLGEVIAFVGKNRFPDPWLDELLTSAQGLLAATAQVGPGQEAEAADALVQKGNQLMDYFRKNAGETRKGKPAAAPEPPAVAPKPLPPASYSLYPTGHRTSVNPDELARKIIAIVENDEKLTAGHRAKLNVWITAMRETWKAAAEISVPALQAQFQSGILMRSRFLIEDYRDSVKVLGMTDVEKAARIRTADILAEELANLEKPSRPPL